ncbi:MAG: PTS sugar transporter subunit IIA, partial [Treponema sp.]|nr:PTS sugar transporter subunit IIA [Treponema sp.]
PILNVSLSIKGRGTKKEVASSESQIFEWDFKNQELTHLVMDILHRDLRAEGFYVQMMNITDGICTARRGDTAISLREEDTKLVIETDEKDMGFVKGELYEIMIRLNKSMQSLSALKNTASLQYGFASPENRVTNSMTRYLNPACISVNLKGNTKEEIFEELITLLCQSGNVENREMVKQALFEREKSMSTGLEKGIAIPHAKTDGVKETCVAIGIKADGVDFNSLDGKASQIFVMLVSPINGSNPLMRAMAAFSGALMHDEIRTALLQAKTPAGVIDVLKDSKKM